MGTVTIGPICCETSRYAWRPIIPPYPACGVRRFIEDKKTGERFLIHDTERWFPIVGNVCELRFLV